MNIPRILLSLVIVLAATVFRAADNPSETQTKADAAGKGLAWLTDVAKATEPVIPKRELKFDVSEEEESLPLQNVQEGMLDQRYVAVFRFKIVRIENKYPRPDISVLVGVADSRPAFMDSIEFHRVTQHSEDSEQKLQDLDKVFRNFSFIQRLVITYNGPYHRFDRGTSQLPNGFFQEHPAAKEIDADFLKNAPFVTVRNPRDPKFMEISLLAPSVEEAKKWTADWLAYYDWAISYPAQKECIGLKNKLAERLPSYRQDAEKAKTELSNLKQESGKFQEFEDLKPESLANLITQRRMLSIDLVGLIARVDACNKMLADKNAAQARKDQIETVKAAAEIELLGLEAKQQEINRIIQGARDQQKHIAQIEDVVGKVSRDESLIKATNDSLEAIDKYQLGYQSLPVEDGKVTIRRIKWTSPPKAEERKK